MSVYEKYTLILHENSKRGLFVYILAITNAIDFCKDVRFRTGLRAALRN